MTADDETPRPVYVHFTDNIMPEPVLALVRVFADLSNEDVERVVLCLATDGGNIPTGVQLYNVLRAMPFELTIHAVGDVSSAGNIVFVGGRRRVASPNTRFTFHEPSVNLNGLMNVKELREQAAQLQSNGERNRGILEERTKLSRNEINALKRRTSTVDAHHAVSVGLAHSVKDLKIPGDATQLIVP